MSALVVLAADGELRVSSIAVADRTEVQHKAVLQLLRSNLSDFETFGRVAFEMAPFETSGGVQRREIAHLNEQQATLLITYMRNSEVVRAFKLELVKQFYDMRQALSRPVVPQTFAEALELAASKVRELEAAEQRIAEAAPKVEAYDAFIDADGTYAVGTVAKMVGLSQNKLFDRLRNDSVLISKGAMRNTPYQQYMHHFSVKAHDFERSNGDRSTSYTTRVQPSGVDFIRRKLSIALITRT
jgi:anti-repressor protein